MFAFRLCLALGCSHPDALLRSLTSRQLAEWETFYTLEPFGDQRADLRAGIVAATISNRMRGKHENPLQPVDFMPYVQKLEQTPEEMKRTLQSILGQVIKHG